MSANDGNNPRYKHLRCQNGGLFSRGSLWLADDHVLQITSTGLHERYRRFYLRDIKAIMVGEGFSAKVGGFVCGFIAFFFGLMWFLTAMTSREGGGSPGLLVCFLIMLAVALLFLWRGRTVKVYVVTELQTVLLRSVARKWQADKLIEQLTPLINASQADLTRAQPTMPELPSQPELPQMQPRQTSDAQNPDGGPGAA
ncbi:hypothetical protein M2447_000695 [Ereboglobus sp. PH5-10]|uniref:ABC transporter permease n=1 Tax=Ereboglobus sp. PH5-10 TaxID=2940629 RepID=UPI00240728E5|nr:ABC transporter permease [Ereboglobus sp. PH5-10]MDF9826614.1 hypothetical protein [Ereboglobus sp. PH5-10]